MALFSGDVAGGLRRAVRFAAGLVLSAVLIVLVLGIAYRFAPPVSTLMLARWATLQPVERVAVPLEAMAPSLAMAVVASEDGRFCTHHGVDWDALRDVIEDADDDVP